MAIWPVDAFRAQGTPRYVPAEKRWVVKPADTVRNNTATLTADPDLQFEAAPNTTYWVDLHVGGEATNTADILSEIVVPSGTATLYMEALGANETGATGVTRMEAISAGHRRSWNAGTGNFAHYRGVVQVGDTGGTVAFQWAQNTAEVSDAIVLAGSTLTWETIPE